MKSKTLMCLVTLATSLVTSAAQSNVIGYAQVSVPSGFSLLANPLSGGVTNGANEIMVPIEGEIILTWNGTGFNWYSYDSTFGGWIDSHNQATVPPSLPPGTGFFFFNPGPAATITFQGRVVPGPASTNTVLLPTGYSLVASSLPGTVNNISSPPISLPLIDGMQILTWDGSGYVYFSYDTAFGGWIDAKFNSVTPPAYSIGQGFFFFNPGPPIAWQQSLP